MKKANILFFVMAILVFGCKPTEKTQTGQTAFYNLEGEKGAPEMTEYNESFEMKTEEGFISISMNNLVLMKGKMEMNQKVVNEVKEEEDTIRVFWVEYKDEELFEMSGETERDSVETNLIETETVFYKDKKGMWDIEDRESYSEEDLIILLEEISDLNSDIDFSYPTSIRINEEYEMPRKSVKKLFGSLLGKTESGKVVIVLIDVIEKENDKIAVLDCMISANGSFKEEDGTKVDVSINLSGTIYRSLIWFEDLKMEMEGTMSMISEIEEMGESLTIVIEAPVTLSGTLEPIEYNH